MPERRLIAVDDDGTVAGIVTVVPGVGWTGHVGDIRLVVLPEYRGQGIGRRLAAGGQELAEALGMTKLMIEITATNTGGLAMFAAFGFVEEHASAGHVRDSTGTSQDLVLLSRWLGSSATAGATP